MCMKNENNNLCCCIFTIIASLLAAAGIAGIFYAGLITSIATLLYITLILGILGLLYILITIFCGGRYQCKKIKESCLIPTSVGSIVTSIFALTATGLATGAITVAILIGAVAFFLVSTLINLANIFLDKLCGTKCDD